jgi:predicted metal-dependent hydrolase
VVELRDTNVLRIAEREIPLLVTRNPRARRISIRLDGVGAVRLVLPKRTPLRHGLDFAEGKADWIVGHLDSLPALVPFEPGAVVPVLGVEHVIRHRATARRGVWRAEGVIWVSGEAPHLARRVRDFLKAEARREISARAHAKAMIVGRPVRRITLRDTTSRWGSCGADGNLSFSWRLILAPETVLDYVVAHEIAHLKEMNHGRRFWALVARLNGDVGRPRRWLRDRGDHLLRYG